jgi:hypothetical protein
MGDIDVKRILQRIKVDDSVILAEEAVNVPFYGKDIEIKQINWWNDWESFAKNMGKFLYYMQTTANVLNLPNGNTEEDLVALRDGVRFTLSNVEYGKLALTELIGLCKYFEKDIKWMKKNFSIDDWVTLFLYIYIYNILGVKKNTQHALALIKTASLV